MRRHFGRKVKSVTFHLPPITIPLPFFLGNTQSYNFPQLKIYCCYQLMSPPRTDNSRDLILRTQLVDHLNLKIVKKKKGPLFVFYLVPLKPPQHFTNFLSFCFPFSPLSIYHMSRLLTCFSKLAYLCVCNMCSNTH